MHGFGKLWHTDKTLYEGQFKNDMKEGQGTITFPSGKKYVGLFKSNKQHGDGEFFDENGESR